MEKACFYCQSFSGKLFTTLPCGCRMCKECFMKKFKQATNDKLILNEYEKCILYLISSFIKCKRIQMRRMLFIPRFKPSS